MKAYNFRVADFAVAVLSMSTMSRSDGQNHRGICLAGIEEEEDDEDIYLAQTV